MQYLPLCVDVRGRYCLLVGGGDVATRKARLLAQAGAVIDVVAPEINDALVQLAESTGGACYFRDYNCSDLQGKSVAIGATDVETVNRQLFRDAREAGCLVNVVDRPDLCDFVFPAIVDRDPLIVAISSSGQSPVLARILRSKIETLVPEGYGKLAGLVGSFRDRVKKAIKGVDGRRHFWEEVLEGPATEMVLSGKTAAAQKLIEQALLNREDQQATGEVYLVGAGPGDPDLLTFRALRLMQQADIVLYDRLVPETIVDLCRRDAERVYVGKAQSCHAVPQEEINALLRDYALQGKRVLRLKGGDPFIFGRGGEEIELLAQANIPFQVVPGITAASGCASYAGIPLTHRDYAQSVRFVTGHLKNDSVNLNWVDLAQPDQTLVFYMGLKTLPIICDRLVEAGLAADTPAAVVQQGTTPNQRVLVSDLGHMPGEVANAGLEPPTLFIVGHVVALHDKLSWYYPESLGKT
jgi:uroporphyrin-III C-methyltransferase/precorrin-2 dehydrogenase/sirohydrochlorin ferrochelatase